MGKKRDHHRRRSHRRDRRRRQPSYDWTAPLPDLQPEDRLSTLVDYGEVLRDYDEVVTQFGKQEVDACLDDLFFLLRHSNRLLDEPEFRGLDTGLDPHDFLVFEAAEVVREAVKADESLDHPDGGYIPPLEHILEHAVRRYLTPSLSTDLWRRARRTARRCRGTGLEALATGLEIGLEDEGIPPLLISLIHRLFSGAIFEAVLVHEERFEREWEERDRSLDPWMEEIRAGDFDDPTEEAVEKLVAAGARALPHLTHLWYETDRGYDDYAVATAFDAFGRIPSQLSLGVMVQGLLDDDDWSSELAANRLAALPELACPYFLYALTKPGGPDWLVALYGYEVVARARCPGAFDLLVEGLSYAGDSENAAEGIQVFASSGLVELGDERAIPILREWLRDPSANAMARQELIYELTRYEGRHPWTDAVVGDLTPETLPE